MSGASTEERISVEEALARTLERVAPLAEETVALEESLGRVLARDVASDIDVSPFDNSSMDGFAVRCADIAGATPESPVRLTVVGGIGAGNTFGRTLEPGQALRIMTGAPVPAGADAIVKYELVQGDGSDGSATFSAPATPGDNVRRAGEEFHAGDVVMRAGETISPYAMGMLASAGALELPVYRRPVVGVFSIGSELVDAGEKPTPGKIRNSNTACLVGLVQQAGAIARSYPIVSDDRDAIKAALRRALDECDMVVSAGGASKGDFDFINPVIDEMGEVAYAYISLRPGKRQTMGVIDGKPVFGLSGNPAAASVGFELLIRPALRRMAGHPDAGRPTVVARLAAPLRKKEDRRFYNRGELSRDAGGEWIVTEYRSQSSALLGGLARCNCLMVIPEQCKGLSAGDPVTCLRIDMPEGTVI